MIINSESEYNIAIGQLEQLTDDDCDENDPMVDELVDAIVEYEEANYPIDDLVDDVMEYGVFLDSDEANYAE